MKGPRVLSIAGRWLLALMLVIGCQMPMTSPSHPNDSVGTLVVDFGSAINEADRDAQEGDTYTVVISGPRGQQLVSQTTGSVAEFKVVPVGSWSVVVQGMNDGALIASGAAETLLAVGQTAIVTVKLKFKPAMVVTIAVDDAFRPAGSDEYSIGLGGSYRLDATVNTPTTGTLSYFWYLNGNLAGNGSRFDLNLTGLKLGEICRVDIAVTSSDGSQAGSGSVTLRTTGYRVVYQANVPGSSLAPSVNPVIYSPGNQVALADKPAAFSQSGYLFLGWNTEPDRSGTTYYPGEIIESIQSAVELYAVWYLPTPNASPNDQPTKGLLDIGGQMVRFDVSGLKQPSSGAKTLYLSGLELANGAEAENMTFDNGVTLNKARDSLEVFVQEMIRNTPKSDQVLIAYSQGGLRALGYAHAMSRLGYGHRIKGIIFLTSPVRGFPALSWGEDTLLAAVNQKGSMVRGYIDGLSDDLGHLATDPWFLDLLLVGAVISWDFNVFFTGWSALVDGSNALKQSAGFIPQITRQQVLEFTGFSQAALDDLTPGKRFTRNYAGVSAGARYWAPDPSAPSGGGEIPLVQVHSGQIVFDSRKPYFPGLAAQYPGYGFGDGYSPIACQAVLPSNIAVAFVVGSNSDPLQMNDPLQLVEDAKNNVDLLLEKLNWQVQLAYKTATFGFGVNVDNAVYHGGKIHDLLYGGYKDLAGGLLGDLSNDGFIPRFAQFRSPAEIGGYPIEGSASAPQNVYEFSNLLHIATDPEKNARLASEVWGTGQWGHPIVSGAGMSSTNGTIPYLFSKMIEDPSLSQDERSAWGAARNLVGNF